MPHIEAPLTLSKSGVCAPPPPSTGHLLGLVHHRLSQPRPALPALMAHFLCPDSPYTGWPPAHAGPSQIKLLIFFHPHLLTSPWNVSGLPCLPLRHGDLIETVQIWELEASGLKIPALSPGCQMMLGNSFVIVMSPFHPP